jgi:DNA-binding GntR family transcriptional regulator
LEGGKQARLVVAPLTGEDASELFAVVGGLEAAAARRAAVLPAAVRARLAARMVEFNHALHLITKQERPDQNEIFELDTAFHRAYVEAGAGPRLLALHDSIKPQAERYVRLYISALVDQIEDSISEHERIIEGVRQGDADLTEGAVLQNWRHAAERFSAVIARHGERGIW